MEKNTSKEKLELETEVKMEKDLMAMTISPSTTPSQSLLRREFRDERIVMEIEQKEKEEIDNMEFSKELSQDVP